MLNPSPKAKARMQIWLLTPKKEARGTISGISRKALAEPEGIKKFSTRQMP